VLLTNFGAVEVPLSSWGAALYVVLLRNYTVL
jgi:hypothetical protein